MLAVNLIIDVMLKFSVGKYSEPTDAFSQESPFVKVWVVLTILRECGPVHERGSTVYSDVVQQ
jgi:hypothetical protein